MATSQGLKCSCYNSAFCLGIEICLGDCGWSLTFSSLVLVVSLRRATSIKPFFYLLLTSSLFLLKKYFHLIYWRTNVFSLAKSLSAFRIFACLSGYILLFELWRPSLIAFFFCSTLCSHTLLICQNKFVLKVWFYHLYETTPYPAQDLYHEAFFLNVFQFPKGTPLSMLPWKVIEKSQYM